MMKRFIISFTILTIINISLFAQKKELTMNDAVMGQYRHLSVDDFDGIQAKGDNNFTYIKDYTDVFEYDSKTQSTKKIYSLAKINGELKNAGIKEMSYIPFWDYSWKNDNVMVFQNENYYIGYDYKKNKLDFNIKLPEKAENVKYCKEKNYVAYTLGNNLFFMDYKSKVVSISGDKNLGIVNGSDYVHRQEFGIDNGIFWSPKGNFIAFYRKDETMVTDYPLVDIATRIATVKNTKYPMAGEKSEEVTLGIYNLNTGKKVFAEVTDFTKERYLTSITWGPNEKFIYIGVLNREQNHLKLNKYDALTGKFVKTLFEEKHPKYVEPEHQLIFLKKSPDKFLWYSERDNYNHLYLFNDEGKLINQVTKGDWIVLDFLGFNKDESEIFITATKDSPIETNFYNVKLKSGKITRLTKDEGVHNIVISNSKTFFIDKFSNTKTPNIISLKDEKGKEVSKLLESDNPLVSYNLGKMTIGTIKSADGKTDLYYRLITPPDFDPKKKYPTVVYVYGGPHAQLVTNSWLNGGLWLHLMAQKGYVMFTIDNRGSANRGLEFENVIHRQCGQEEMKDQMKGIEFLKSLPYVDENRIGVHGWSYGGFMTTSLITNYPETFKAAVAGGPVIDWKYYEVMYGERYMDTPQENPEGYEKTSLLHKAKDLKGRLLIIHGYIDPVVVPQNSIDFLKSCIEAGTDTDFFLYPESEHNMRGKKRIHLMEKVTRYFEDYLK